MNLKDFLFWIFLFIAMGLLIWNIFGNSPTEMFTIIGIIFMLVLKVWNVSDAQVRTEMNLKMGFNNIKKDINLIKTKLKIK